jgi:hypothetical protein
LIQRLDFFHHLFWVKQMAPSNPAPAKILSSFKTDATERGLNGIKAWKFNPHFLTILPVSAMGIAIQSRILYRRPDPSHESPTQLGNDV